MKFAEGIKKIQEEAGAALRKAQKEMKQQADREREKAKEWKKKNKVMPSTKNLMFKERLAKKASN